MTDFIPLGYMTIEQALDEIGRCLMPEKWLGTETGLLMVDSSLTEASPAAEEAASPETPAGRLNVALKFLIRVLYAGEVNAVFEHEDGVMRPFPSSLWANPDTRAVFRSGELPVHLRVALEGHKAGARKSWVLIPRPALHHLLGEAGAGVALPDIDTEFRAWLRKRIGERAEGKRPSKKQLWTEAQALFGPRLGYRSFNRLWSATEQ